MYLKNKYIFTLYKLQQCVPHNNISKITNTSINTLV